MGGLLFVFSKENSGVEKEKILSLSHTLTI